MGSAHHSWTLAEEAALAILAPLGAAQVAEILCVPESAVRRKASRMGRSLRRKSEINVTDLSNGQLEQIKRHSPDSLCPSCGKRLIVNRSLGVCGVCYKAALTDAHRDSLAQLTADREYNTAKQQLCRERRRLGIKAPNARGSVRGE